MNKKCYALLIAFLSVSSGFSMKKKTNNLEGMVKTFLAGECSIEELLSPFTELSSNDLKTSFNDISASLLKGSEPEDVPVLDITKAFKKIKKKEVDDLKESQKKFQKKVSKLSSEDKKFVDIEESIGETSKTIQLLSEFEKNLKVEVFENSSKVCKRKTNEQERLCNFDCLFICIKRFFNGEKDE